MTIDLGIELYEVIELVHRYQESFFDPYCRAPALDLV
jgi:hypothetical protein